MAKKQSPTKEQLEAYVVQLEEYTMSIKDYVAGFIGTTPPGPKPKNPPGVPK